MTTSQALLSWRPRWREGHWSALVVGLCVFTSTLAVAYASSRDNVSRGLSPRDAASPWFLLVWVVGVSLAFLTLRRRQLPEVLVTLSCAAALILPLDPTVALVGLHQMIVRGHRRLAVLAAGIATTIAVAVSVHKDGQGTTGRTSLWHFATVDAEGLDPLTWWQTGLITLVLMSAALGFAVNRRLAHRTRHLEQVDEARSQRIDDLSERVARQDERERLAREIHDALGHRLSLMSIHAGALEQATATADPKVAKSAHLVQQSAQQSVEDLRSLLSMLRQPQSPDNAAPVRGLDDIGDLLDESLAAGSAVVATVLVERSPMSPVLGHTAYRTVQELLTNARKHAPNVPIRLEVAAKPGSGIEIATANALPPGASRDVREGNGLIGLSERVAQLGGRSRAWVEEDAFKVSVWLPWEADDE